MELEIIANIITGCVTVVVSILSCSKLTDWRLSQLEKQLEKLTDAIENIPVLKEKISVANHRIDDLEEITK